MIRHTHVYPTQSESLARAFRAALDLYPQYQQPVLRFGVIYWDVDFFDKPRYTLIYQSDYTKYDLAQENPLRFRRTALEFVSRPKITKHGENTFFRKYRERYSRKVINMAFDCIEEANRWRGILEEL